MNRRRGAPTLLFLASWLILGVAPSAAQDDPRPEPTREEAGDHARSVTQRPEFRDHVAHQGVVLAESAERPSLLSDTKAKILEGGGEFTLLLDEISYVQRQPIRIEWTTQRQEATLGAWEVRNLTSGGQVVATGQAGPAPEPGAFARFTIPGPAFLPATAPTVDQTYEIRVRPFAGADDPAGPFSLPVRVTHLSADNAPEPTVFGEGARFPVVRLIGNDERSGQVPGTQLFYAHADVALSVSNPGSQATDPMFLGLTDRSLLYRQEVPKIAVPALKPGAQETYTVRLQALLPPATSQTPQEAQHRQWRRTYDDRCGPELVAVLDWRGPQSQTPIDPHRETVLPPPGWEGLATGSWSNPVCDGGSCLKVCDVEKSIRRQLDGNVVGYAYLVGGRFPKMGAGGLARTNADGEPVPFTPQTPITVASVSKLVTAIAAMTVLDGNGVELSDGVGPYFPAEWNAAPYFQNVTFAQYLGQRSGIKDYGNVAMTYAKLQSFFQQNVDNASTSPCNGPATVDPPNAVTPANMGFCYSNYNTGVMRILLPSVAGSPADSDAATRPQTLADQYEQLVKQNVFDRVGQSGPGCRPPGFPPHAYAYKHPGTELGGHDWGDVRLTCGAAGWYLSVADMGKVLFSLNQKSGHIFDESSPETRLLTMRQQGLGWDIANDTRLEKNGGWAWGNCEKEPETCRSITTSAGIFGPYSGPNVVAVLFINSDIGEGPAKGLGARQVLERAYDAALKR
jgi:CubicO group peptidase (beta-lactamase class C family)